MLNRSDIVSINECKKESIMRCRAEMSIGDEPTVWEVEAYYDAKQTKYGKEYIYVSYGELKFVDKAAFDAYEKAKLDKIAARMKECRTPKHDVYKESTEQSKEENLKKFQKMQELKKICK